MPMTLRGSRDFCAWLAVLVRLTRPANDNNPVPANDNDAHRSAGPTVEGGREVEPRLTGCDQGGSNQAHANHANDNHAPSIGAFEGA